MTDTAVPGEPGPPPDPERPKVGSIIAARAVIRDRHRRILAVLPAEHRRFKNAAVMWYLPGGTVWAHESPREGARREVHQELGVDLIPGRQLMTAWVSARHGTLRSRLQMLFDFGEHDHRALSDRFTLQTEEIVDAQWLTDREARKMLYSLQFGQLEAIRKGVTYIEQRPLPMPGELPQERPAATGANPPSCGLPDSTA